MSATAKLRKLHISPRKTRLVVDLIRGMNAQKALHTLQHLHKRSALPISKLLRSAVDNYQQVDGQKEVTIDQLYVKTVYVGSSTTLKRIQPAPRGVAHPIRKRSSHITLVVDQLIDEAAPAKKNQKEPAKPNAAPKKAAAATQKKSSPKKTKATTKPKKTK